MSYASYWRDKAEQLQAALNAERKRALSAEAKLAQAVEDEREACAREIARLRALLNSQNVVIDISREDAAYQNCEDAIRARAAAAMGEKT